MRHIREYFACLRFSLASTLARPRHVLLASAGLLVAALTMLVVLTIPASIDRLAARTGSPDIAVVLASQNSWDETDGNIAPELIARMGALPGVAHDSAGKPLVAPQFVVTRKLKRRDGSERTLLVRGVPANIWAVVGKLVHIVQGRQLKPGLQEMVAGTQAAHQYLYTSTGAKLRLGRGARTPWHVSGEFVAGGGLWESELWTDMDALRGLYNAPGQSTCAWVRLASPAAFDAFVAAMHSDPRLRGLQVYRQQGFYARRVAFLTSFADVTAIVVSVILGLMAILACNNAVGLALRSRRRELAVLRATGFGNVALAIALVTETLVLATLCTLVSATLGWLLLHARTIDSSTLSMSVRFTLAVTPSVIGLTLAYTLLLGLAGSLIPAWRTVRAPLASALARE